VILDVTLRDGAVTTATRLAQLEAQLVARESVASLGQLAAGIVHEIKNPLNFVTSFSALSIELLDELKGALATGSAETVQEVVRLLSDNLAKIREHGRRADSIMRSMLLQARGGSGQRQASNLNGLVAESFALAYHGARGKAPGFNCRFHTSFDPTVGTVDVVPEEITRVLVNLASNAFYATESRRRAAADPVYMPTVEVTTKRIADMVELRVRDNGVGIPENVRQKLFTAFFTTKPVGEGTGLGLSLSAEIIRRHGGAITVESVEDSHTTVTIHLPLLPIDPALAQSPSATRDYS
jgi:signal transduction histidine kinase